jgi:hypothetical protein
MRGNWMFKCLLKFWFQCYPSGRSCSRRNLLRLSAIIFGGKSVTDFVHYKFSVTLRAVVPAYQCSSVMRRRLRSTQTQLTQYLLLHLMQFFCLSVCHFHTFMRFLVSSNLMSLHDARGHASLATIYSVSDTEAVICSLVQVDCSLRAACCFFTA